MNPNDRYISIPHAAALIGISANGMRRLLDEGLIPCIRPQSHRRVRVRDVKAFEESVREGGVVEFARDEENALA